MSTATTASDKFVPSSVLVLGANGYIGFAVAQVFRQNGYKVYGLVRKPEYTKRLANNEIIPVVGDAADPKTYEDIVKKVRVVIELTSDWTGTSNHFSKVLQTVTNLSTASDKKIFVGTSGILAHASGNDINYDEHKNLSTAPFIQQRISFEKEVTDSKNVHGIVLRPGSVYGYTGGFGSQALKTAFELTEGKINIYGSLDKATSWVHVYDVAHAYFLAVQKYEVASGQVFNIVAPHWPTVVQFRKAAAAVAGHKDAEVVQLPIPADNPWLNLVEVTLKIYPKRAESVLGWIPVHGNILDDLENIYVAYNSYKN